MMRLHEVRALIEAIAEDIGEYGREVGFPPEVYQPLIDGLAQLQIFYRDLAYWGELFEEISESALALGLLIEALDLIRSILVLPTVMIDEIGRSDVITRPQQVGPRIYDWEDVPRPETTVLSDIDTGDVAAFLRNYDLLVQGAVYQLQQWDEYNAAAILMRRYSEGEEDV